MSADRKLEEIPVLQGKLAMVNEIQTETQKQLSQQSLELDQVERRFV